MKINSTVYSENNVGNESSGRILSRIVVKGRFYSKIEILGFPVTLYACDP